MTKKTFDKNRPLSWSAISSFEYDKEEWYRKYVLGVQQRATPAMTFGKKVAEAIEAGKPPARLTILSQCEHELHCIFEGISLIGFIDTYEPGKSVGEFKTGKRAWTQKRVDEHGQLDMYLLCLFVRDKVHPETLEVFLEWMPTQEHGDFSVSIIDPDKVHHFKTKRTMTDILRFGARIKRTYREMEEYCQNHD